MKSKLSDFGCCERGSLLIVGNSICNTNTKFLERVRDAINDLLGHLRV
jgi:hypothetical protein